MGLPFGNAKAFEETSPAPPDNEKDFRRFVWEEFKKQDKILNSSSLKLNTLEANMRQLLGNGQPGWMAKLSDRVRQAERVYWMLAGGLLLLGYLYSKLSVSEAARLLTR